MNSTETAPSITQEIQKEKSWVEILGWIGCFLAGGTFISFIDQIILNLNGQIGSKIMPIILTANCIIWTIFGLNLRKRNWQVALCNMIGTIMGILTVLTSFWPDQINHLIR